MTTTILIIINVFAALAIIGLTLMQQSKGDMGSAFGGGGGSSQSMFGSRGASNFLSRTTAIMTAVFFISSLTLAYVYAKRADDSSVIGDSSVVEESVVESDVPSLPSLDGDANSDVPSVPVSTDNVSDTNIGLPDVVDTANGIVEESTETVNEATETVTDVAEETQDAIEEMTDEAVEAIEQVTE